MIKKLVFPLVVSIIAGCATQPSPVYSPPPPPRKCDYTIGGKCKDFTADDKQGNTTYGNKTEINIEIR